MGAALGSSLVGFSELLYSFGLMLRKRKLCSLETELQSAYLFFSEKVRSLRCRVEHSLSLSALGCLFHGHVVSHVFRVENRFSLETCLDVRVFVGLLLQGHGGFARQLRHRLPMVFLRR